jgi:hypothetical protein
MRAQCWDVALQTSAACMVRRDPTRSGPRFGELEEALNVSRPADITRLALNHQLIDEQGHGAAAPENPLKGSR